MEKLNFEEILEKYHASNEMKEWANKRDGFDTCWHEFYETCPKGEWLLWLFKMTTNNNLNCDDFQRLILAKGYCADTVKDIMIDDKSKKAVEIAIAFGEGNATRNELNNATYEASSAAISAYSLVTPTAIALSYASKPGVAVHKDAAVYAAAAAAFSSVIPFDFSTAAYAAAAYAAVTPVAVYNDINLAKNAYDAARGKNEKMTADICRIYLPIKIWNMF